MTISKEEYIAGRKTRTDWFGIRARLLSGEPAGWREVFKDYFVDRLRLRYLDPIQILQDHGTFQGEGFSIVAIQCSLIEFLESTAQGKNYRYISRGQSLGSYEYSSSQNIFISFLANRIPFSKTFNETTALDFYVSVRCGLLHEARTKNGWRIWASGPKEYVADVDRRIVFRNNFQGALLEYIDAYGKQLQTSPELQQAFIRKFDDLCS